MLPNCRWIILPSSSGSRVQVLVLLDPELNYVSPKLRWLLAVDMMWRSGRLEPLNPNKLGSMTQLNFRGALDIFGLVSTSVILMARVLWLLNLLFCSVTLKCITFLCDLLSKYFLLWYLASKVESPAEMQARPRVKVPVFFSPYLNKLNGRTVSIKSNFVRICSAVLEFSVCTDGRTYFLWCFARPKRRNFRTVSSLVRSTKWLF